MKITKKELQKIIKEEVDKEINAPNTQREEIPGESGDTIEQDAKLILDTIKDMIVGSKDAMTVTEISNLPSLVNLGRERVFKALKLMEKNKQITSYAKKFWKRGRAPITQIVYMPRNN